MQCPKTWQEWSYLAQIVGVGVAAVYFGLRLLFGYLMINLSVEPTIVRRLRKNEEFDDTVLTLKLMKGDREGMRLGRIAVSTSKTTDQEVSFTQVAEQRFDFAGEPALRLSPGESTSFSFHFQVPRGEVVTLRAEVFGAGSGFVRWPQSYWQVRVVSLPELEANRSIERTSSSRFRRL